MAAHERQTHKCTLSAPYMDRRMLNAEKFIY